jgi:hypothetical protein
VQPATRQFLAVPFVGKDVPSEASEFSHPDVLIGLTVLAYRYEGLRLTDFHHVLRMLRDEMLVTNGCEWAGEWIGGSEDG